MIGWKNVPDQARAALEHLRQKFSTPPTEEVNLEWARRIMARKARGEVVAQATLDTARDALRANGYEPAHNEGSEP